MKKHNPGFKQLVAQASENVQQISVADFNEELNSEQDYCLIDVREDYEWDEGHIFGALHISKGVLESDIEAIVPDKNKEIVVYCRGGFRSILAADSLQKMGYTNVKSLTGGITAWVEANLEIDGDVLSAEEQSQMQRDKLEQQGYL